MTKVVVRLPEPKKEYTEDNQRQINRAINYNRRTIKLYIFNTIKGASRKIYLVQIRRQW